MSLWLYGDNVLTVEVIKEVQKYSAYLEAGGEKHVVKHWIGIFRYMNIAQK